MAKRSKSRPRLPGNAAAEEDVFSKEVVLPPWNTMALQAAIIALVGLWAYWPALHGDWLWDDDVYITKNPLMNDPHRLWKAWFVPGSFMEYYPIEQTVEWMQWRLWGAADTFGYHLTNVLLHIANALLIWRLFAKLGLSLAWVGGLLFVAHPVNVESVAWIVELKNALAMTPFLLAMIAWVDYEDRHRPQDYALAFTFFVVAMLCKIAVLMFPGVTLLYAWWKRGRIGTGDLAASAPFFAVSLVLVEVAMHAAHVFNAGVTLGQIDVLPIHGAATQWALAGLALAFYFSIVVLPLKLLPIYPVWDVDPVTPVDFLPWLIVAAALACLWWKRQTWGRHGLLGFGFFLLMLAPMLSYGYAFFPRDSWVMDHFLYFPMLGLVGLAAAALGGIDESLSRENRTYVTGAATAIIALMAFETHAYASAFTNSETLWSYTLERNPGAWTAHINLGSELLVDNQLGEAKTHFEAALHLKPDSSRASADLGATLFQLGMVQQGIAELERALAINPHDATTRNNLGVIYAELGRIPEAQSQFEMAIQVQPSFAEPYNNLGNTWFDSHRLDRAETLYRQALALSPDYAEAHFNLGNVLDHHNDAVHALPEYIRAIELKPDYVQARLNLGALLAKIGHPDEAAQQFAQVLQIDPANSVAHQSLARLQAPAIPAKK